MGFARWQPPPAALWPPVDLCTTRPLPHGRYVVWTPASSTGHFEAVLSGDTLAVIDEDGEPEDRAHENIILVFSIRLSFR